MAVMMMAVALSRDWKTWKSSAAVAFGVVVAWTATTTTTWMETRWRPRGHRLGSSCLYTSAQSALAVALSSSPPPILVTTREPFARHVVVRVVRPKWQQSTRQSPWHDAAAISRKTLFPVASRQNSQHRRSSSPSGPIRDFPRFSRRLENVRRIPR